MHAQGKQTHRAVVLLLGPVINLVMQLATVHLAIAMEIHATVAASARSFIEQLKRMVQFSYGRSVLHSDKSFHKEPYVSR